MNRIDQKFRGLKKDGKKAFIVYITAGDPNISMTKKLVLALAKAGADIIELGIPFSDPLADGPTIQAASQRALKNRVGLRKIFSMVGDLRAKTDIPIALMTYYNPVFKYGPERFMKDCRKNGVDGLIVPDLPYEEGKALIRLARREAVASIFLAAPTSTRQRLKDIAKVTTGFIYYVSVTGVTGAREKLPSEVISKIKLLKSMTKKPVCVGFGVSGPRQARDLAKVADGIIVGSAIIKVIERNLKRKDLVSKVSRFAQSLAKAVHNE